MDITAFTASARSTGARALPTVLVPIAFMFAFIIRCASGADAVEATIRCPLCGNSFKVERPANVTVAGGMDRDRCPHDTGRQPIETSVWTCDRCFYSGGLREFQARIPVAFAEVLKEELGALRRKWPEGPLPAWRRHVLSAKRAEILGFHPGEVGSKHLQAAWCFRFVDIIDDPEEAADRDPDLAQLAEKFVLIRYEYVNDAKEEVDSGNPSDIDLALVRVLERAFGNLEVIDEIRPDLCIYAACLCRNRGEHALTEKWLKRLAGLEGSRERRIHAAIAARLEETMRMEKECQRTALDWFIKGEKMEEADPSSAVGLQFVIGETCRRLGEAKEAAAWFKKVLDCEEAPASMLEAAVRIMADMDDVDVVPLRKVESTIKARISELVEQLRDPARTFAAGGQLQRITERDLVVDALLEAVEDADPFMRERAGFLLALEESPRVLPYLRRVLASDPNPAARCQVSGRLENDPSPETLEAFKAALMKEDGFGRAETWVSCISRFASEKAGEGIAARLRSDLKAERILALRDGSETGPGKKYYRENEFYFRIVLAAGAVCGKNGADPLGRILSESKDEKLAMAAGAALERLTNMHFGCSWRKTKDGANVPPSGLTAARETFSSWWQANREKSRSEWLAEGFKAAGLEIGPDSDPGNLYVYLAGLTAEAECVRFNSRRNLARLTNHLTEREMDWEKVTDLNNYWILHNQYTAWLTENEDDLVWDEKLGRFQRAEGEKKRE